MPKTSSPPTGDPLWSEFKSRKAQNLQREKERDEAEIAKREQLKALEEAEKRRIEEKRKQELETKDREIQKQREAERRKRSMDSQSVNLTSQSEIMAHFQKTLIETPHQTPEQSLQSQKADEEVL